MLGAAGRSASKDAAGQLNLGGQFQGCRRRPHRQRVATFSDSPAVDGTVRRRDSPRSGYTRSNQRSHSSLARGRGQVWLPTSARPAGSAVRAVAGMVTPRLASPVILRLDIACPDVGVCVDGERSACIAHFANVSLVASDYPASAHPLWRTPLGARDRVPAPSPARPACTVLRRTGIRAAGGRRRDGARFRVVPPAHASPSRR